MGEVDSITNVGNARLRLFNVYRKENFKPSVEDMTEDYVEEGNIRVTLNDSSNWISTTYITKYFDEYLKSNSTLKLNSSTLKNYLSKLILMLKDKFTNHCPWEEL